MIIVKGVFVLVFIILVSEFKVKVMKNSASTYTRYPTTPANFNAGWNEICK